MPEGLNIPKREGHLKKGVKPIMTCVGTPRDFDSSLDFFFKKLEHQSDPSHNVDYKGLPEKLKRINFLNGGHKTYVFSVPDNRDKFSEGFFNCTGLVVAGIDKETGKNVSFLSHQDPRRFLNDKKDDFIKHLIQRLTEMKDKCIPGTIDAVVVGGNYLYGMVDKLVVDGDTVAKADYSGISLKQGYIDSIELLSSETKKVLGFNPGVVNGPKKDKGHDDVYFDNENRRLYLMRSPGGANEDTGVFTQPDIKEEKKKWENKKLEL